MYNHIHKKIEDINNKEKLIDSGDKILVALSGGADSVALLLALKEFYPSVSLFACHVNHMLRGNEADRDMHFAEKLCKDNGIQIEILKTDVNAYAKTQGLSTELAARKVRYDFFVKVCKKHGINKVATAHTLSDNAETVLFNLTRGTGLHGLCGIPAKRTLEDGIMLIRPILYVSRSEIEEYLAKREQDFVTDSSNLTDDYTRNYFRHKIVPLLKEINPSFEESLKNTCATVKDVQIFIDKSVNNNVSDDIGILASLDNCLLTGAIIKLYEKSTCNTSIENVHVNAIAALVKNHASGMTSGKEICLPCNISAVIDENKLKFIPTVRNKIQTDTSYCIKLEKGLNIIENSGFAISVSDAETNSIPEGFEFCFGFALDSSVLDGDIYARSRQDGDSILSCGMNKKVKSLFTQKKISSDLRARLPFLCDNAGILAIPGICLCDRIRKCKKENNNIYIYVYSNTTK